MITLMRRFLCKELLLLQKQTQEDLLTQETGF